MTFGAACTVLSIASIYWPPRGDGVTYGDVAWLTVYLVIMVWGGLHVARGEEVTGWGLVILAAYSLPVICRGSSMACSRNDARVFGSALLFAAMHLQTRCRHKSFSDLRNFG